MRVTQGRQQAVWFSRESIQWVIFPEVKHKPLELGLKTPHQLETAPPPPPFADTFRADTISGDSTGHG